MFYTTRDIRASQLLENISHASQQTDEHCRTLQSLKDTTRYNLLTLTYTVKFSYGFTYITRSASKIFTCKLLWSKVMNLIGTSAAPATAWTLKAAVKWVSMHVSLCDTLGPHDEEDILKTSDDNEKCNVRDRLCEGFTDLWMGLNESHWMPDWTDSRSPFLFRINQNDNF